MLLLPDKESVKGASRTLYTQFGEQAFCTMGTCLDRGNFSVSRAKDESPNSAGGPGSFRFSGGTSTGSRARLLRPRSLFLRNIYKSNVKGSIGSSCGLLAPKR